MENFAQSINTPGCVSAIYCLILYAALKIYFKRKAILSAEQKLECEEYIICDITPFILIDYLLAFAYGYILFEIINFHQNIDTQSMAQVGHYIFLILKYLFVFCGVFILTMLSGTRTFITNQRILIEYKNLSPNSNLVKIAGEYRYKNIKICFERKTPMGRKFIIKFKSLERLFVIYSIFTFCYKPAIKVIESTFNDIKEIGYETDKAESPKDVSLPG